MKGYKSKTKNLNRKNIVTFKIFLANILKKIPKLLAYLQFILENFLPHFQKILPQQIMELENK